MLQCWVGRFTLPCNYGKQKTYTKFQRRARDISRCKAPYFGVDPFGTYART
jgi:hypothetical protein